MPVMIWRDATNVKMIGGTARSIPVAMITPQSMSCSVSEFTIVIGTVRVLRSARALARRNSFHEIRKVTVVFGFDYTGSGYTRLGRRE